MKANLKSGSRKSKLALTFFLAVMFLLPTKDGFTQYQFEFEPSISASETYDDNIDLTETDETSDFITALTPAFDFSILSQNTDLQLHYSPSFVFYAQEEDNNTVRHQGSIDFTQQLSKYFQINVTDTHVRSEEPLETTEGIEGIRRTRNPYNRNNGQVSLHYIFGSKNDLSLGYDFSYLDNDDPAVNDGTIQTPFLKTIYWLDVKKGFELDYQYKTAIFSRDDGLLATDDYDGHEVGVRIMYKFKPQATGSMTYRFTTRDFDGVTEDYDVHEAAVGYGQEFSPTLSMSAKIGYFSQDRDRSGSFNGITYNVSLEKSFEHSTLNIGGAGGWDEAFLEAESRGFTRFQSIYADYEHQLLEALSIYGRGSYRMDEDESDREWYTVRGTAGTRWNFHRWYSLLLDYSYSERDDDVDTADFEDNKVMLRLTAGKLFKW